MWNQNGKEMILNFPYRPPPPQKIIYQKYVKVTWAKANESFPTKKCQIFKGPAKKSQLKNVRTSTNQIQSVIELNPCKITQKVWICSQPFVQVKPFFWAWQ